MSKNSDFTDQLQDIDVETIKSRSMGAVVALISRSFIQRLISTLGFFFLSVYLGRPEIGLFIILNDFISILGYFSDIGLAASLIQKKSQVSVSDLRSTFTLQQILVWSLVVVAILLSGWVFSNYSVDSDGQLLYFCLLIAFMLSSLKTIPSVVLERQLKFRSLATIDVLENTIFYFIAVLAAVAGLGVKAYAIAVLARGLLGTILLYKIAPWPIGLGISKESLKQLLSFGLPFQLNSLLAVAKDRLLNLLLWRFVGADGIGILGWAQNWSQLPLRFVMDNVTKVTFPAISRLQHNPEKLRAAVEKSLFFICLLSFPILATIAVFTPVVVQLIPRYDKWSVALLPLALYCLNSCLAAVSTPLTSVLNAIGKVKINTYLMIMWTLLAWILTPIFAVEFGFQGVAYATALISLTSFIPVIVSKRYIEFSIFSAIGKPGIALLSMLIASIALRIFIPPTLPGLVVSIIMSGLVYVLVIFSLVGQELIKETQQLLSERKNK